LLDPTDVDFPVALNLLEHELECQRYFLIQEFTAILMRLLWDELGEATTRVVGPIFFQHLRRNLLLAMSNPEDPGTLLEFYNIYQQPGYWRRWMPLRIREPLLERWVKE